MFDTGPVRHLSPEDFARAVRLLECARRHLAHAQAECAAVRQVLDKVVDMFADVGGPLPLPAPSGGRRFLIHGRTVSLSAVPAEVLLILAAGESPGARWYSTEDVRRRVAETRKKEVTSRAIVQAVYQIRQAFVAARLSKDLIRSHDGGWKLAISDISLADLRTARPDAA